MAKITKASSSFVVYIPPAHLANAKFSLGEEVTIESKPGVITIRKKV